MNCNLSVYLATMRSGKSTLALSSNYNKECSDLNGLLYSCLDDNISSRMNVYLNRKCTKVDNKFSFMKDIEEKSKKDRIDYIIIDEAQFLTNSQVEELGVIVDNYCVDITAYGLLTDFRGKMFEGSKRLLEICDHMHHVDMIEALCWCGKKGVFNCRIDENGLPNNEGDIKSEGEQYEVLCREHYFKGITKAVSESSKATLLKL